MTLLDKFHVVLSTESRLPNPGAHSTIVFNNLRMFPSNQR